MKLSKFITHTLHHSPSIFFIARPPPPLLLLCAMCLFIVRSNDNNWMARRTYFDDNSIKLATFVGVAHFMYTRPSCRNDTALIVILCDTLIQCAPCARSRIIWPEYWHLTLDSSLQQQRAAQTSLSLAQLFFFPFFHSRPLHIIEYVENGIPMNIRDKLFMKWWQKERSAWNVIKSNAGAAAAADYIGAECITSSGGGGGLGVEGTFGEKEIYTCRDNLRANWTRFRIA